MQKGLYSLFGILFCLTNRCDAQFDTVSFNPSLKTKPHWLEPSACLTKVKTKTGRLISGSLNIIKLPFLAIEINTLGQVVFHPIHFLNFSLPINIKK